MYYVTRRSHPMQNRTGITRAQKKVRRCFPPGLGGMLYMDRRSNRMQKHKFGITCPSALFRKPHQAHPSMKNSASMFHAPDAAECTM
jgi:hypothetical protein